MSDEKTEAVRTKNQKNHNQMKRDTGVKVCVQCDGSVYPISHYLQQSNLPPVLSELVLGYLHKDQPVGYAVVHKPSRRTIHVVCTPCLEDWVNQIFVTGLTECAECPKCRKHCHPIDMTESLLM
jgi:hypothetical protein